MDTNTARSREIDAHDLADYLAVSQQIFEPVLGAIYKHEFDLALELLEGLTAEIDNPAHSPELREALGYDHRMHSLHRRWHSLVEGWTPDTYRAGLAEFAGPAETELGEAVRNRWHLRIRFQADTDGFEPLARKEILKAIATIPHAMCESLWFDISTWAFEHSDLELTEKAFVNMLMYPQGRMHRARWQRVNMMYQLLKGKATAIDIRESINSLELKPQVSDFLYRLWPVIKETGLVTEELELHLEQRIAKVENRTGIPGPERKTRSFIKGGR